MNHPRREDTRRRWSSWRNCSTHCLSALPTRLRWPPARCCARTRSLPPPMLRATHSAGRLSDASDRSTCPYHPPNELDVFASLSAVALSKTNKLDSEKALATHDGKAPLSAAPMKISTQNLSHRRFIHRHVTEQRRQRLARHRRRTALAGVDGERVEVECVDDAVVVEIADAEVRAAAAEVLRHQREVAGVDLLIEIRIALIGVAEQNRGQADGETGEAVSAAEHDRTFAISDGRLVRRRCIPRDRRRE